MLLVISVSKIRSFGENKSTVAGYSAEVNLRFKVYLGKITFPLAQRK